VGTTHAGGAGRHPPAGAVLVDFDARGDGRATKPAHIEAGIEDAAVGLVEAAQEGARNAAGAKFVAVEEAARQAEHPRGLGGAIDGGELARVHGGDDVADALVGTVDVMIADQPLDFVHREIGQGDEATGLLLAEELEQGGDVLADGRREVPGVATAGSVAAGLRFQQDDAPAFGAEGQCGTQARVAAADDDDIRGHVGAQRRTRLRRFGEPGTWSRGVHRPAAPGAERYGSSKATKVFSARASVIHAATPGKASTRSM
jgi:hypothetical protein